MAADEKNGLISSDEWETQCLEDFILMIHNPDLPRPPNYDEYHKQLKDDDND